MATDAELLKEFQKQALRRARTTSIILGGAFVVSVLFMVYGLTQDIEATRMREKAIANEKQALSAKIDADRQRDIANEQTSLALQRGVELEAKTKEVEAALMEAVKFRVETEKALRDCRNKK